MFTVVSLSQIVPPPCPRGHIETPGFVCVVPPADRYSDNEKDGEIGHGSKNVSDDSIISAIAEWLSGIFG